MLSQQQQQQQMTDARQAASMVLANPYMLAHLSMGASMPGGRGFHERFPSGSPDECGKPTTFHRTGTLPFQGGFPPNMTSFGQNSFLGGAGLSAAQIQPTSNLNVPDASNYAALRGGSVANFKCNTRKGLIRQ